MLTERCVTAELGQHTHGRIQQTQALSGPGDRGELVGDAEARYDTVDLIVEMDRSWLWIDVGPTVQNQTVDDVLRKQGGGRDPGRAGADDHKGHGRQV